MTLQDAPTVDQDYATMHDLRSRVRSGRITRIAAERDGQFMTRGKIGIIPPTAPLIDGVLERNSYALLRGRDSCYKSFVALDWSLSLATGIPWLGRPVEKTRVLYVAAEGVHGIANRILAWELAHSVNVEDDMFVVRAGAVNIFKRADDYHDMLGRIVRDGYDFIVLDTLRRMSGEAGENGSDMGRVVDSIEEIRECTVEGSVLVVAHTDKADRDTRGFSGIEDDADSVWASRRSDSSMAFTLTRTKAKDGVDRERLRMRAGVVDLPNGKTSLAVSEDRSAALRTPSRPVPAVPAPDGVPERVMKWLADNPYSSRSAIRDGVGSRNVSVREAVDLLVSERKLAVRDGLRGLVYYIP